MQIFYRRPAALVCAAFISVSLLGFFVRAEIKYIISVLLVAAALVVVALFARGKLSGKKLTLMVAATVASLVALACSYLYFDVYYMSAQEYCGRECYVSGTVTERRYAYNYSSGFSVIITEIDGKGVSYRAILDCAYVSDLQPGYSFDAVVTPEALGYSDIASSDKKVQIADGFVLRCVCDSEWDCKIADEKSDSLMFSISALNRKLSTFIKREVGGEEGKLAVALALGNRDSLSDKTVRDFNRSGVSHLLALSGMHMTVIMGIFGYLLIKMKVGKATRCVLLILITFFYLALTGFSVTALRSALMLALVYLSFLFAAQPDSLTSLFLACAVILLVSPDAVADAAFWLSFSAVLGIIVGVSAADGLMKLFYRSNRGGSKHYKHIAKLLIKVYKATASALVTALSANIALLLCVWLYYGEISVYSVFSTICLSPFAVALLAETVAMALLFKIPYIVSIISALIRMTAGVMLNFTELLAQKEGAVISLKYGFAGVIIVAMTASLAVMAVIKLRHKWLISLPPALAAVAFSVCLLIYNNIGAAGINTTYLNYDGNEMLVITSCGEAVICDLSDGSMAGTRMALESAGAEGASEVRAFVLTHYHQKHISTVYRLCSNELVGQIWLPEPQNEKEYGIMLGIISTADTLGCPSVIYDENELEIFGEASLCVRREYIKRSTHPVLFAKIKCWRHLTVLVGASVWESSLDELVNKEIAISGNVIIGSHGPIVKTAYSYENYAPDLTSVVFADDAVLTTFRYAPEQKVQLDGAVLVRSPQFYKIRATRYDEVIK